MLNTLSFDVTPDENGWQVVLRANGIEPAIRRLRRLEAGLGIAYPQLDAELPKEVGSELSLCCGGMTELSEAFGALRRDRPHPDMIKRCGRYLFEMLIGDNWWQQVHGDVDLRLQLHDSAAELDHLPWELLRDQAGFLLASSNRSIALTRVRGGSEQQKPLELDLPLRVLVIVAASLDDQNVRAAAEYCSLIETLRGNGLPVHHFAAPVLTVDAIAKSIRRYRPQVIHIIGHGDSEDGRGFLRFDTANRRFFGNQLLELLSEEASPPPVVVLSACYGGGGLGEPCSPLAAELVAGGVGCAIGMGGRVADLACRFFAQRFYETLLKSGSLQKAIADGRSAVIRLGGYLPEQSLEWSRPAFFLASSFTGEVQAREPGDYPRIRKALGRFRRQYYPRPFCDHIELLAQVRDFLSGESHKVVLAILAEAPARHGQEFSLGKTRLLDEIAMLAIEQGYAPIAIRFPKDASGRRDLWPKDLKQWTVLLDRALRETREAFDIPSQAASALKELERLGRAPAEEAVKGLGHLSDALRREIDNLRDYEFLSYADAAAHERPLRIGLREDLHRLAVDLKTAGCDRQPLVLSDDLDAYYGDATKALLETIGHEGLGALQVGNERRPVKVVLCGCGERLETEAAQVAAGLKQFVEGNPWVQKLDLGSITALPHLRLAMQQLNLEFEAVPVNDEAALTLFQGVTKGYPSRFGSAWVEQIGYMQSLDFFSKSRASDILKAQALIGDGR